MGHPRRLCGNVSSFVLALLYFTTICSAFFLSACQATKGRGLATVGCPLGTVFVSPTDRFAHFKSVQEAVHSLPNDSSTRYILIGRGVYNEAVNISRQGPTTLLGQTNSPHSYEGNLVTIWNSSAINQSLANSGDDAATAVLTIAPSGVSALVGSGFYGYNGSPVPTDHIIPDVKVYNLNLENRFANFSDGPALALDVSFANASFYGVSFKSEQDTLYVGHNGSAYFKNSEVLGYTDYIFGFGLAWFQNSLIGSRGAGGGVTAWKGTTNYTNTYGCYFDGCLVVRAADADPTLNLTAKVALGRPWNNASRVVFMRSYMDSSIRPDGFIQWSKSDPRTQTPPLEYAEYDNFGPGANASTRASFDQILNSTTVKPYLFESVFGGKPRWIDYTCAASPRSLLLDLTHQMH